MTELQKIVPASINLENFNIPFSPEKLVGLVQESARIARELVREGNLTIDWKPEPNGETSPVTNVDRAVHEFLKRKLTDLVDALVISEEEIPSLELRQKAQMAWIIDPIDNTEGLVNRRDINDCGINIALIVNGEPVLGLAYFFTDDTTLLGIKDQGAFTFSANGGTPITTTMSGGRLKFIGYMSTLDEMNQTTRQLLEKADPEGPTIVYRNRLPLRLRAIATGDADVYIDPRETISEWDLVAIVANINAIGGSALNIYTGSAIKFNTVTLKTDPFILMRPGVNVQEIMGRLNSTT
jgi:3'(2'), 5'-bisphosphate nucleotidase